ncbi:helix-turn-helix transcriptional regulator [Mammaliicoccus vitulinus]|uniref:helix-turn-helix transcriptional regulator n=1 Tax=Mammaliicoccus vitulinus TaxID=71237 RepID=UPI001AE02C07|nr:helix-turn-helix transcriptional regulator [Mammaliicoccus vitulinus]
MLYITTISCKIGRGEQTITLSSVKDIRKNLNLTQKDMSKLLGITGQYYNMIENNKKQPSVAITKKIGSIIDVE